jgi:hypothetical protein
MQSAEKPGLKADASLRITFVNFMQAVAHAFRSDRFLKPPSPLEMPSRPSIS